MEALGNVKAIITDQRRDPSGFIIFVLWGKYFVPKCVNHGILTNPVYEGPGFYREDRQRIDFNNPDIIME